MTTLQEQVRPVCLEPLTPVHIGSGDTLEPITYLIRREEDGRARLYTLDIESWVEDYHNPNELAELFGNKPLPEVRSFLAHNIDPEVYGLGKAEVISEEIVDTYEKNIGHMESANQLLIDAALSNNYTGALVIPGSSIKGAIRTAVIDYLDDKYSLELKKLNNKQYEDKLKDIFGPAFKQNTFQDLKIGDFEAKVGESSLVSAKEVRQFPTDRSTTPKNDCLVSLSLCSTGETYPMYGTMSLGRIFGGDHTTALRIKSGKIQEEWSLEGLFKLCNKFYGLRYLEERKKFYSQNHLLETKQALKPMDRITQSLGSEEVLLRLGHYSHVECVTITNNNPMRRKVKGRLLPTGTTRTLANGLYPFGWVRLRLCTWQEWEEGLDQKRDHDHKVFQLRNEARERAAEQVRNREQERLEQERREAEAKEAQAKREAELEAMSEEERLISLLENNEATENQVVDLYFKLDSLDEALKLRAAKVIKATWKAEKKKWSGKLSSKQKTKVAKIKAILGED